MLKKQRIESQRATPDSLVYETSYHNLLSDEEEEELELKSVNSLDMTTFITEPTFHRVRVGKEALMARTRNSSRLFN
jgi:hypothetical protein